MNGVILGIDYRGWAVDRKISLDKWELRGNGRVFWLISAIIEGFKWTNPEVWAYPYIVCRPDWRPLYIVVVCGHGYDHYMLWWPCM